MGKVRKHHVKVLESKSGCKMDNMFHFCLPITGKGESKSYMKVLESKSGCKMDNMFHFCLPITGKGESKSYINDEIY